MAGFPQSIEKPSAVKILFNDIEIASLSSLNYRTTQSVVNHTVLGTEETRPTRFNARYEIQFTEVPYILSQVQAFMQSSSNIIYSFDRSSVAVNGGLGLEYGANEFADIVNSETAQVGVFRRTPKSFAKLPPFNVYMLSLDETEGVTAVKIFYQLRIIEETGGTSSNNGPELTSYSAICQDMVQGLILGKDGNVKSIRDAGIDSSGNFKTDRLLETVSTTTIDEAGNLANPINLRFAEGQG